jgi:hypothetical protein
MTLAVSIAQSGANNVTMRNRIINGNMMIDQRNAGAAVTISGDPGSYITDRWNGYKGGSTNNYTAQQSTTVPTGNFTNSLIITTGTGTSTGSTDYAGIQQKIEGYNFADIGWGTANAQPVTASFWVRSSVTGTFGVTFRNAAANATYCGTYVISSANTWTFCSVTVPAYTSGTWVTNNGVGVTFGFDLGVGSTYSGTANQWNAGANYFGVAGTTKLTQTTGATFYITGVQVEKGTTATAFEQRLYGTELALCQRYYEVSYDSGNAVGAATASGRTSAFFNALNANSSNFGSLIPFKTTKRTVPSVTWYGVNGTVSQWTYCIGSSSGAYYGIQTNFATQIGFEASIAAPAPTGLLTAGQVYLISGQWAASAEL